MSEFSESYHRAYAIHRAISSVMSETSAGGPISLEKVIRRLGSNESSSDGIDLIAAIACAARDVGVEVVDNRSSGNGKLPKRGDESQERAEGAG